MLVVTTVTVTDFFESALDVAKIYGRQVDLVLEMLVVFLSEGSLILFCWNLTVFGWYLPIHLVGIGVLVRRGHHKVVAEGWARVFRGRCFFQQLLGGNGCLESVMMYL